MASLKDLITRLNRNVILKNVILAISAILVFVFVVSILLNLFTRHNRSNEVPDFSGLNMHEAEKAARHAGSLRIEVNDSLYVPAYEGGIILDQLPKPGTHVKSGRRIFVTVNSYKQKMVRIPYVTGYSLRQAKNNLEVVGLEIDKLVFKPDIANNNVLEQLYNGKVILRGSTLEAEQGSGVTLVVGLGADQPSPVVPKLVGFPLSEAKSRIWGAGLNVGNVEFDPDITLLNRNEAKVYVQAPEQGSRAAAGTAVTLKLSLDGEKVVSGSDASDKAAKRMIPLRQAEDRQREQELEAAAAAAAQEMAGEEGAEE